MRRIRQSLVCLALRIYISQGSGMLTIEDAISEGLDRGSRMVMSLKADCAEFADTHQVQAILVRFLKGKLFFLIGC